MNVVSSKIDKLELEQLIRLKPKTLDDLKNNNILSPIKIKTHGEQIIDIFK